MTTQIEQQIERRRQRALEEIAKVSNKGGHPVFSTFEVTSVSGRIYRVQIRSLTDLRNSCTCPDYRTNLIGTCKHIEGVLLHLKDKLGDQFDKMASQPLPSTQVFLHYGETITVRVSLPLPKSPVLRAVFQRYFDPEGVLQGAITRTLPALLREIDSLPARQRPGIHIGEEVREYLDLVQDREAIQKQKEWFRDQVAQGTRSLSVLSTRLYPYQEEGALHLAFGGRTMLADDMGLGKCIGPKTPVFVNGLLRRAEDIWNEFAGTAMHDGEGEWAEPTVPLWTNALDAHGRIIQARITRLYRQRIQEPMRHVRLDDGSTLMLTRRHKLLLRDGWSEHFQAGAVVCVPGRLEWSGPEVDPDLVTLLAWQIAEGYELTGRATVRITQKNTRRLEQLRETTRRVGQKFDLQMNSLAVCQPPGKAAYLTVDSRDYQRFLAERGYAWGAKSAGKTIPDFIMQAGRETVRLFLREFFSAEAAVVANMGSVELSSASGWLMQQINVLLRRFGIWLRCTQKEKWATNGAGVRRIYYVGLLGGNAVRCFLHEIGFSDEDKQRKLEAICARPANTNVESIPAADVLIEMAEYTGLPKRHFGVGTVYFTGFQELSRSSAAAVVESLDRILDGNAEAEYRCMPTSRWTTQTSASYAALDRPYLEQRRLQLAELIDCQVFYARMAEVRQEEYEGWVYDFEVAEHHNFVAAHTLCHNTVQAIAASALLKELRDIQKVLIVTPASLKHQWAREIRRFTSFPITVIEGDTKKRHELYQQPAFFNIVNYELIRRDLPIFERMRPDLIILDEAQRIKNWRTKTADSVKRLRSRYAFVLTGTPLENRLDELYSIFQFLDPRILGPLWQFNSRFYQLEMRPDKSFKVLGYKNLDELRGTIGPYTLRRTRDEVLHDLPERIDNNFFVEMTREQWNAYEEYRSALAQLIMKAQKRPLTPQERERLLMCLIKMRLICNALALHDPDLDPKDRERTSPKLQEFGHIMHDEIANNGHKAVVFSQWSGMLDLTEPVLKRLGIGHVKLTGQVPSPKRGELIARFFDDPDCRVFLSTDAGGVGLNLQAASLVVNLDLPWNPAVLDQRIGRAHRHGQQNIVNVINLIAQGTIEEKMLDSLAAKRNVFGAVFGSEEAPAEISFRDTGQTLLRRLQDMLAPVQPVIELEPVVEAPPPTVIELPPPKPTLGAFADLLVARFPGRILLVRKAPGVAVGTAVQLPSQQVVHDILVVVDRDPTGLRPQVESLLSEHWTPAPPSPALHLMEQEGYRALAALTGGLLEQAAPEDVPYRAPALPAPAAAVPREAELKRLKKAQAGFEFAAKRLQLAHVLVGGGFPEETLRPIREALGWGLSSHLALLKDRDPSPDLPSSRLVQAELVESQRIPDALAGRLARVRELTEPPGAGADGEDAAPPPSAKAAETMIEAVHELVELGQKKVVEQGL